jgi:hypothetical protein
VPISTTVAVADGIDDCPEAVDAAPLVVEVGIDKLVPEFDVLDK